MVYGYIVTVDDKIKTIVVAILHYVQLNSSINIPQSLSFTNAQDIAQFHSVDPIKEA